MISNEAVGAMMSAAFIVAPDMQVQEAVGQMVRRMRLAEETNEVVVLNLASVISDGLRFGNWPKSDDGNE